MKPDTELINRRLNRAAIYDSVDYLTNLGEKKRLKNCIKNGIPKKPRTLGPRGPAAQEGRAASSALQHQRIQACDHPDSFFATSFVEKKTAPPEKKRLLQSGGLQ
jgi:hypothetical protein